MRRVLASLLLVVLLVGALAPGVSAATLGTFPDGNALTVARAAQVEANNSTSTPTPTPTPAPGETNSSTSSSGSSTAGPEAASTARILPVEFEADFLETSTHKQGEVYNTSGPFALFSVSQEVDQVAISQSGASATVLEGGNQVRVQYEPDAAPVGESSLYTLQIWFTDGSSRTIDLYASETSVSVGAAEMRKYRPLILDILEDAEQAGYERSPEGAESHYADVRETAQLLDSLFTRQAARLFASLLSIVMNPLGIALLLISAAFVALWQLRNNRQALDILSNDSGKAARLRERLWIQYKKQQQTAADESLSDLDGVGEMGEIYWNDAFGVSTTAGLAELFRTGLPVRRDGEIKHVGGVDGLDPETIDSSWLEAVCRDHRLPSVEIALSHGRAALQRMISKYGMGHIYRDEYERVTELIDELDESRDVSRYSGRLPSGDESRGGAIGGDD